MPGNQLALWLRATQEKRLLPVAEGGQKESPGKACLPGPVTVVVLFHGYAK
jgi:hypothetical protein